MLKLLKEYAQKHGIDIEPGFAPKDVRWAICFASAGRFTGVVELGDTDARRNTGQEFSKCPDLTQSKMVSAKVPCHFLVESAERVALLGVTPDDKKTHERHAYFVYLLRKASTAMPQLAIIADCLSESITLQQIQEALAREGTKPGDKVTFRLGDVFLVESKDWHDWWRAHRAALLPPKEPAEEMRDLLTGELIKPVPTHPKVKWLAGVGGRGSGDALIGFDKDAFQSYGLKQSANAALSEASAHTYRASLNHLLKHHAQRLAGAKVVHWFKESVPQEDDPLPWLVEPPETEELNAQQWAAGLLTAIRTGDKPKLGDNYYYALTLSGQSGRVMVRDWMEGQFEELVENISVWFADLAIVHRGGGRLAPAPKFFAVLGATVRDLNDVPAPLAAKMWRVAIRKEPIPQAALAQALARTRVGIIEDEPFNHARMGLMKTYHVRRNRKEGGDTMSQELKLYLNEEHPSPAYQCGRLLAVLAGLQRAALGDVGAGVVQRYYAAASSTPALVLGRLTRTSQFHLNKLEGGLAYWYESQLASIWGRIKDSVPPTLTLEEQSLFALGYYQQMADMRTKKSDNSNEEDKHNE